MRARVRRRSSIVDSGGRQSVWIGANFWSRVGGPRMWTHYEREVVREELAVLAAHGCNVTRSFCYWPDFVPEVETLNEEVMSRFTDFLDLHLEVGLQTIPTFVVGHMSGQNWDPPWRGGRDLYRDVWLVAEQAWFVQAVASRVRDHETIVGWLLSNEMPLYGGEDEPEIVTAWARILFQALRASGATQPASVGDGAWGIETSGHENGFSLRRLSGLVDFVGPHVYPMETDALRQHLTAAFLCELAGVGDRPVVLEEFGLSSDFASDENAAHYYRQVLYSSLLAGATGWVAWNNCDYDGLVGEDPYRHHPFEMHFGLTDGTGRPKPQLFELASFSRLVSNIGLRGWARAEAEAALVIPWHMEEAFPFTQERDRRTLRASLFQSYIASREADVAVSFERERDGIPSGAKLYLVPSTKALTGPGWYRLEELAKQGATVYASYFPGDSDNQRGPWSAHMNALFGIRHRLTYGLPDPVEDDEIVFTLVVAFGDLEAGSHLRFRTAGNEHSRVHLPVETLGAEVVAVDRRGRPALLSQRIGKGRTVLCTYPLEHMAAAGSRVNPEDTWRLYRALAAEAGVSRPVTVDDPRVMVDRLETGDDRELAVLMSEHAEQISVTPTVVPGCELRPLAGGPPLDKVSMAPFGVEVLVVQRHDTRRDARRNGALRGGS